MFKTDRRSELEPSIMSRCIGVTCQLVLIAADPQAVEGGQGGGDAQPPLPPQVSRAGHLEDLRRADHVRQPPLGVPGWSL